MLEDRNPKLDLAALALLALTIFLALALLTYSPADPPSDLVYPPSTTVANVCGRLGAWIASGLFQLLGLGAYYVTFSLAVVDALLLGRRQTTQPWLRALGWALSLVGFVTFVAMAMQGVSPGPVIGAGGYLGAAVRGLLEEHFATAGSYVLVLALLAAGLLLSTDYLLVRFTTRAVLIPAK